MAEQPTAPNTAGVIAPPPVIAAVAFALAFVLDTLWPSAVLPAVGFFVRQVLAAPLMAAAAALALSGEIRFKAAGTTPLPWRPTTALVTTGLYGRLRNPMYVGLILLLVGLALALASDWLIVMAVPAALVLHYGVVLREERYLEAKFGDDYRRYTAEVPRYGWPPVKG
ncbi:methyltransferase family protein [Blastochloris sulfoviridis]|uniref:Isoprenylcysteine carboxylmethyltransferase family protein n=1 Tax=Blastochloris sulfoviridis TaxID=50712 RepID=A0A5M6HM92_9HYPH|nr:isoprenylcysteine carboxylmethyltransferase family protein [Blastochloris sulfoviridis]KAA5596729.1 isoprenylcysteine carboxylmethyltransferase family protein [Blastochloris sulfoviridis]